MSERKTAFQASKREFSISLGPILARRGIYGGAAEGASMLLRALGLRFSLPEGAKSINLGWGAGFTRHVADLT